MCICMWEKVIIEMKMRQTKHTTNMFIPTLEHMHENKVFIVAYRDVEKKGCKQ